MKRCKLININTGKILDCKSVAAFCRASKIKDPNLKIHIYAVLSEKRFSHLGWCLPKYYNTRIKLKDCYGNVYTGKIRDFIDKYDIPFSRIWRLFTGKKQIISGLSLYSTKLEYIRLNPFKARQYIVKTNKNRNLKANTIKNIIKQAPYLQYSNLLRLIHGKIGKYKGYTIKDILYKHRKILNER